VALVTGVGRRQGGRSRRGGKTTIPMRWGSCARTGPGAGSSRACAGRGRRRAVRRRLRRARRAPASARRHGRAGVHGPSGGRAGGVMAGSPRVPTLGRPPPWRPPRSGSGRVRRPGRSARWPGRRGASGRSPAHARPPAAAGCAAAAPA